MELNTSELKEKAKTLRAGDKIELSGTVYTARDAAHKRIKQLIDEGGELPFEIDGAAIYYAGPTGTKEGMAIGSCGPTTSGRMDPYAPLLLDMGLSAMIGKGERKPAVVDAIKRNGAVYFCAIGGAGALACQCITECEVIALAQLARALGSYPGCRWFKSDCRYHFYGPLVKRLRHRPFTAESWVRFPYGSPHYDTPKWLYRAVWECFFLYGFWSWSLLQSNKVLVAVRNL